MISYVKGELVEVFEDSLVIENNGLGYNIKAPRTVLDNIPAIGNVLKLYTYMAVKEDDISLYGFFTRDDLNVYKQLINVNGVGPKVALSILSSISADDLRFAVLSDDVATLKKLPGIGAKTAQRLIIDLKDKFNLEETFESALEKNAISKADGASRVKDDVRDALVALGYSSSEAYAAIRKVKDIDNKDSEVALKEALRELL